MVSAMSRLQSVHRKVLMLRLRSPLRRSALQILQQGTDFSADWALPGLLESGVKESHI